MIAKASEQEPSLKFGELRDVLSPGHRIHDRRSRGRRSDLLKFPIVALEMRYDLFFKVSF